MKVPHQIIRHYLKTSKRYKKLISKLRVDNISEYQRKTILRRIKKLLHILRGLHAQLKIAAATGAVALMLHATPVQAQGPAPSALGPFVKQDRLNNPLREPIFTSVTPAITRVDLDGDGDLDVVVGEYDYNVSSDRYLRYFENRSSQGIPLYTELKGEDNPFSGIHATTYSMAPAFADIDEDGDMDLFLGQGGGYIDKLDPSTGGIEYYRNDDGIFTKQTGAWDVTKKEGNPFESISLGYELNPVFIDFDNDSDMDLVIGSNTGYYPDLKHIHYYENDGGGNFTPKDWTFDGFPSISSNSVNLALADLDGDGDLDLILGSHYDEYLSYFTQVSPGNFVMQSGAWDPLSKTGNPFNDFMVGLDPSPVFIDFNNDGLIDLFVADDEGAGKYSDHIINYYENQGGNIFVKKDGFQNPFDGVFVQAYASPVLIDLDGDQDLDAVVGNKYSYGTYDYAGNYIYTYSTLSSYENNNGEYKQLTEAENPFKDLQVNGYFSPSFGDIDGDGDLDMISGGSYGQVAFFRNTDGAYVHETGTSPFANIYVPYTSATNLVDIDADGDLDLFITNSIGEMFYYKNTGSAQIPEFIFETAENNLLETASGFSTWPISFLEFKDLDHDGDLDLIFNGSNQSQQPGEFLYFENTGTKENPAFTDFFWNFLPGAGTGSLQTEFLDVDGDGDVDVFVGNQYGAVSLLKNENPTVTITIADTPLSYENGADPVLIEPGLILFDEDNDFIIQATVNIENYLPGETLAFTPLGNISGIFDTSTGVLTLRGKGTVDEYQTVLRTVTFEVTYSSGRRTSGKNTLIGKSISIAVYDQDFTNPKVVSKSLEVFVNDPPAINTHTLNVIAGKAGTVDLKAIITDPNGAGDLDLNTLTVIDQPASGAVTSIDANGILRVDYNTLNFTGTETMVIQVCDLDGACVQNSLTVIVVNTPPVMAPQSVTTLAGTSVTINLIDFTSDADGNLDPNSFSIVANPANASSASIEVMSATEVNLIISYEGSTFYGSDELTIRACDLIGSCVQYTLAITVANTPPVIQPEPVSTPSGVTKTINLMTITSDVDGNLNPEGFSIVSPPVSNAIASIVVVSPTVVNLLMDYDGIVFNGMDALTIRACDKAGACTESIIQIQADVDASHSVMVFNAVAPNSSGNNRFMRISGLPQENKVSIFNRWGDKVYHTENYSNDPSLNAFQGLNNNGNSLPSGTYFYTIEIPGRQAVTGYLTLKQ